MKWKLEKTVQDRMMLDNEKYNLDYLNISNNIGVYEMNILIFHIRSLVHNLNFNIYSYHLILPSGRIIQIYYWVDFESSVSYHSRLQVIFKINTLCNNNNTCLLGKLHYLLDVDEMEIGKNN